MDWQLLEAGGVVGRSRGWYGVGWVKWVKEVKSNKLPVIQ